MIAEKGEMTLSRNRNNRVGPIYAVAALWLAWVLVLPLFSIMHYMPLILLAVAVYNLVNAMGKKRDVEKRRKEPVTVTEVKKETPKKKSTGNPQVDALIEKRDEAISEMRRLNVNIENPTITAQINDMEYTTSKIFDHVIAHPDKAGQISKFLNYYLPTTIKLLNTYDRMNSQGIKGDNITGTMKKVEETLQTVVEAYHKQLDTLFAGEALDINSDITVMENLMRQEGLTDDGMNEIKLTLSDSN